MEAEHIFDEYRNTHLNDRLEIASLESQCFELRVQLADHRREIDDIKERCHSFLGSDHPYGE